MSRKPPSRLVDLHCDWLNQYIPETTVFDPAFYPEIVAAAKDLKGPYFRQADGYLQGTAAAVITCHRCAADWASQADPWSALDALVTRIEAEFPGRLLIGPDDLARWRDDRDGLCWAIIGVEGFDALARGSGDLDRLPALFERGVRVFQPVYGASGVLAGSSEAGDERGLTDLGRAFLQSLADLDSTENSPRPVLDLAHMNPVAMSATLDWFEADPGRASRVLPVYSHGALRHDGFPSPRAITLENLGRLRALGGVAGFAVGPHFYPSAESLRANIEAAAALPYSGRPGFEGLAIGSDFLGMRSALPGMENAEQVVAWLNATFPADVAAALGSGNAEALIERAVGGVGP